MKNQHTTSNQLDTLKVQLFENINIGKLIENYAPLSMQGSQLKSLLIESVNNNKLNTIKHLAYVVEQCNNLCHVDANAFALGEAITEKLAETIKYQVLFCLESLQSLRTNAIVEHAKDVLSSALLNEDVDIKNTLRSGSLNKSMSIPSIAALVSAAKIQISENQDESTIHQAYVPVSYVETINENTFIRLDNHVLAITENSILQAKSPSPKFSFMSTIVENMTWNHETSSFDIFHDKFGKFMISETAIQRQPIGSTEITETNSQGLIKEFSVIVESMSNKNEKQLVENSRQFIDAVVALYENYSNIALLDNCVIVENKQTREKFSLIVTEQATYMGVLKSSRFPNIFEKFNNVNEGLSRLKYRSGYDATAFFATQKELFENTTSQIVEQVEALRFVIESLEAKHTEIGQLIKAEKITEDYSPEKVKALIKSQTNVDVLIIEQKNALAKLLKA